MLYYNKILEKIFSTKAKVKVILFLAKNEGLYSSNALSKKVGMSQRAVLLALRELEEVGLIEERRSSYEKGFGLSRENWFFKNIVQLVLKKESQFLKDHKEFFKESLSDLSQQVISILFMGEKFVFILGDEIENYEMNEFNDVLENIIKPAYKKLFGFDFRYETVKENYFDEDILREGNFEVLTGRHPERIAAKNRAKRKRLKRAFEFFGEE